MHKKGFTLVELLIVIAIMSLLASMILASIRVARLKAYNTRAQADGNQLRSAILQLEGDTNQSPSPGATHTSAAVCIPSPAVGAVTLVGGAGTNVGLTNDGTTAFPSWKGPYIANISNDPWGTAYRFYSNGTCNTGVLGCGGIANGTAVRAVVSFGIDRVAGGGDDIFTVLCK